MPLCRTFSEELSLIRKYFVSLHPEQADLKSRRCSCCSCICASAASYWLTKLTRFCLAHSNLENSNKEQDGVRRFTYIFVGLSSHVLFFTAIQSLSVKTWDTQVHVLFVQIKLARSISKKIFCIWDHTTCEGMYDPQSFSFRN